MPSSGAYFDTSVLVKRYLNEPGSMRARELIRRLSVVSSSLAPVEVPFVTADARQRIAAERANLQVVWVA